MQEVRKEDAATSTRIPHSEGSRQSGRGEGEDSKVEAQRPQHNIFGHHRCGLDASGHQ